MRNDACNLSVSIDVALDPNSAFNALVAELQTALHGRGISFEPRRDGRVRDASGAELGHVAGWEPGRLIHLQWRPADWAEGSPAEVELRFTPRDDGATRITVAFSGTSESLSDPHDVLGWFASEVAAPLLRAASPAGIGDWVTDRRARRPSGAASRSGYREPVYHYPNFRVILNELALTPADRLLDVGCGGGALLHEALRSGCSGAGIDHSVEMVQVARELNADAIAAGRLVIEQGDAERLPFPDDSFTHASMTGVLGFLANPVRAFREIRRVLKNDGRFVAFGSDPALRGTPAAPEPIASRLRFYSDQQLRQLAVDAGFGSVTVVRRELLQFAREAGVPEEHLALFADPKGAPFLVAIK